MPKMLGRSLRYKTPVGKKCPLKAVALAARTEWLNKWKCRKSLCDGLSWKYKMGCKNPGDSPPKGEGWHRKAMRRTTTKWKTSTNEDTTTTKWRWQPTSQKPPRRFSQAKYQHWEFLTLILKKIITELIITKKFLHKNFIKFFFEIFIIKKL